MDIIPKICIDCPQRGLQMLCCNFRPGEGPPGLHESGGQCTLYYIQQFIMWQPVPQAPSYDLQSMALRLKLFCKRKEEYSTATGPSAHASVRV